MTAIGGDSGDGIGKGYSYNGPTITIGTVTIYDGIDKVDASSIKDFANVVYMHVDGETETDVTANKTDNFTIIENGDRRIIVQKVNPTIAEIPDQTYTGSAITPEPLVIAGSLSLTKGTDYTYSYTDNTNVGTATVRATFQGDYESLGYVERTFTIMPSTIMVSVTGGGTVTIGDKSASDGEAFGVMSEKGASVTLTLAPESGNAVRSVDYAYTNSKGTTSSGCKLPISDGTATLTIPTDLKDGTSVTLTVTFAAALVGGTDEASAVALTDATVTDLAGGWYKVESDITFDHTLNLLNDTHLTIAEGATMTVTPTTGKGIDSDYTLNVSGAGTLNVTGTGEYSIAIRVGNYVQTGAVVTASGFIGIRCYDGFDADVTNDFTFSGGQLTVTGTSDGIRADNAITISCTNASDFIKSSSYDVLSGGTIKVADGKALTDADGNILTGTLDAAAVNGKTLEPCLVLDETNGVTPLTALAGQTNLAVAFTREFTENVSSTICLPFGFTPNATEQGAFHQFNGVDGEWQVHISAAITTELDPNKAYLFIPAKTGDITFSGTIASVDDSYSPTADTETAENWTFVGTYEKIVWDDAAKWDDFTAIYAYMAKAIDPEKPVDVGKFVKLSANGSITLPFRAVMKYKAPASGARSTRAPEDVPATLTVVLDGKDGSATAIGTIDTRTGEFTPDSWYSLDGRKLDGKPTRKGLYIHNGTKINIR